MVKSKIVRVPKEFLVELDNLKRNVPFKHRTDGFMKMLDYARIGQEVKHKDLLNTNALWFSLRKKGKK